MKKILIIKADFYKDITDALSNGALAELTKQGYVAEIIEISGAFELPAAIAMAIETNDYIGYIALGCVIRGETSHYDYVCRESARGLNELAISKKVAIGYGIITVENHEQALERALISRKNKGASVANACIEMIKLREKFAIKIAHKDINV